MTPVELAWAAGLFEGEGSVRIAKPGKRQWGHLCVDVPNTDEEIVRFFQERWPSRSFYKVTADGNRRDFWRWRLSALAAAAFLRDIHPYVRTERVRSKIALGLKFQDQKVTGGRNKYRRLPDGYRVEQQRYYEEMRELNQRGRRDEQCHGGG